MRCIYSFFLYLLTPWLFFRLWWKGRALPAYRQRISERFAYIGSPTTTVDVWLHAVSLGEVIAASPLIDKLRAKGYKILVTTMTPTGSAQVKKSFGETVAHCFLPYDLPGAVRRFMANYQPKLGIIVETELWPNLIHRAHRQGIPMLLVNARLSEKSAKGYQKIKYLIAPILQKFTAILAQTPEDAERFGNLGANKAVLTVMGNIKFDIQVPSSLKQDNEFIQQLTQLPRPKIILASTHDNEEEMIFRHWRPLQQTFPQILLLVAPRHPERFAKVEQIAHEMGFKVVRRSKEEPIAADTEIVILDSLGELLHFYAAIDLAFVGGSLIPRGGHNVLEPVALGVPVISGSHVANFQAICKQLHTAEGLAIVHSAKDLISEISTLLSCASKRKYMVDNASAIFLANSGAADTCLNYAEKLLRR